MQQILLDLHEEIASKNRAVRMAKKDAFFFFNSGIFLSPDVTCVHPVMQTVKWKICVVIISNIRNKFTK